MSRHFAKVVMVGVLLSAVSACADGGGSAPYARPKPGSGAAAAEGAPCSKVGETAGMEHGTLICTDAPGGPVWKQMDDGATGGGNDQSNSGGDDGGIGGMTMARVGTRCNKDGAFGFGDGMVTVCDSGKYRYALPDDVPAVPAGGYTKRPDWYPTIGEIFGPKAEECNDAPVKFTHPVIESSKVSRSMPAGMMIGDHVTPIDHMYIGISALDRPEGERAADAAKITSPADGTVIEVSSLGSPTSNRVVIAHGCGVVSVYMVVNTLTGVLADYADQVRQKGYVPLSLPVKAGDEIGTQTDNPIDFNIFDGAVWLPGLANPFSYAEGEAWKPYTTDPFPYFANGTGDALLSSMQRTIEPRWGVIDGDVPGTAAGSWFLDGTIGYNGLTVDAVRTAASAIQGGQANGKSTAWNHLSLSRQPVDDTAWIFSAGWWSDPNGDPKQALIDLSGGQKAPDRLTPADGVQVYTLEQASITQPAGFTRLSDGKSPDGIGYTVTGGDPMGWVMVQVVDDTTIAIEIGSGPVPTTFSAAKRLYHR